MSFDYTKTAQVLSIAANCGKNIDYKENNKFQHFFMVAHALYVAGRAEGVMTRRVNIYYNDLKQHLKKNTKPEWFVDLINELEIKFKKSSEL
jgi:hypothetical protein